MGKKLHQDSKGPGKDTPRKEEGEKLLENNTKATDPSKSTQDMLPLAQRPHQSLNSPQREATVKNCRDNETIHTEDDYNVQRPEAEPPPCVTGQRRNKEFMQKDFKPPITSTERQKEEEERPISPYKDFEMDPPDDAHEQTGADIKQQERRKKSGEVQYQCSQSDILTECG